MLIKNVKLLVSIIILELSVFSTLKAQVFNDYYTPATIRNYVPPSPNAAGLGKYAEIPVSYSTGIPQISIPFYTIETGNISLPISLSYHSSGVKVEEEASWVGLGWSLNAGGVITRVVKGIPDDQFKVYGSYYSYQTGFGGDGFFDSAGYFYSSPKISAFYNGTYHSYNGLRDEIALGQIDGDPDIFYFNFGKYTGTFIFDQNRIPRLISGSDLKITFEQKDNYGILSNIGLISSFTIITEDGTKYEFEDAEKTTVFAGTLEGDVNSQSTRPYPYYFNLSTSYPYEWLNYNSSWYLSRIVAVNGPQQVTFSYDSINSINLSNTSQKSFFGQDQGGGGEYRFINHWSNSMTCIHQKKLNRIDWVNGYMVFEANYPRIDTKRSVNFSVPSPSKLISAALTDISIYNTNDSLYKKYHLDYSNFKSTGATSVSLGAAYGYYRLRLDSIHESSLSLTIPAYKFEYDESVSLPNKFSCEQDFWGYYNGNGDTNTSLIPNIYVYPDCNVTTSIYHSIYSVFQRNNYELEYLIPGADRNSNFEYAKSGVLNKIRYPMGGYETFRYELNSFKVDVNTIHGCGLRISEIKRYSCDNDSDPEIRNFSYDNSDGTTSGIVMNIPEFAYYNYIDPAYITGNHSESELQKYQAARFSAPQIGLGADQSNNVNYQFVTFQNPGNGKTVNEYSFPVHFGIENFINDGDTIYKRTKGLGLSNFPFAPNPNCDFTNGKLKSETFYNDRMKIREIRYQYALKSYNKINAFSSKTMRTESCYYCSEKPVLIVSVGSKYFFLYAWSVLSQKTEVDFNSTGDSIKKVTDYTYRIASHKQLAGVKTNSSIPNEDIEVKYIYPGDLLETQYQNIYFGMAVNNNMISYPIEQTMYKNNNVVASQLTTYKTENNYYVPDQVFKIETDTPLTSFNAYNGHEKDSHYSNVAAFEYHTYDTYSNPLTILFNRRLSYTYLWGYNGTKLLAETKNANTSECSYSGFENNEFNSWYPNTPFQFENQANNVQTGRTSLKIYGGGTVSRNFFVGLNASEHSGYKASVWVKGADDAYIKMKVSGQTTNVILNNSGNSTEWHLLEIEMPRTKYDNSINENLNIIAEVGSTGVAYFDDLRFYPMDAQMTTYTYDPLIGITSSSDINNKPTYYEYDGLGRLVLNRDYLGNILKKYDYNYKH